MKRLKKDHLRLAATYLAIIMGMSLLFSAIFYSTTVNQLERQRPGALNKPSPLVDPDGDFRQHLEARIAESEATLAIQLIGINLAIFVLGALASYLLAEQALRPIEENLDAQDRFISDASHELRTPITALKTANEVALRDRKLSPAEAREVIAQNVVDAARLQALASSLLDLVRERPIEKAPVKLATIISAALTTVVPQAQQKDITIDDTTKNMTLQGDSSGLVQVLTILLDNAIKYSPKGSAVTIASETSDKQRISVIDHGVGIDTAEQKQIFDRFYRADTSRTASHTEGYGLGLSIARKIAHDHGGDLTVTSKKGAGATFTLELPS